MSIEGAGNTITLAGAAKRVLPVAIGTAAVATSCKPDTAPFGAAFVVLLSAGLFPDQAKDLVRSAWHGAGAALRSVLARPASGLFSKHEPQLPTIRDVYMIGFSDQQWATFVYEDLFKVGAKGDGLTAYAILKRHGVTWDTLIRHRRPFKRGGGSLTTSDVRAIVKEFGLSDEVARLASIAWSVRAAWRTEVMHDANHASRFFARLATIAGIPPSPEVDVSAEGYSKPFVQLIGNVARYIESGLPHVEGVLAAELSCYYRRSCTAAAQHDLGTIKQWLMMENQKRMDYALSSYFHENWTDFAHANSIASTLAVNLNPYAAPAEAETIRALHQLGQSLSHTAYAQRTPYPKSALDSLHRALEKIGYAADTLFVDAGRSSRPLATIGLYTIARFAAETAYGKPYRLLRHDHPQEHIAKPPQLLLRSCPPKSAAARVLRGLMRI